MLELRPNCESCDRDLPPGAEDALICSFECTFCRDCAGGALSGRCPNCGGELVARPRRPEAKLAQNPASTTRVQRGRARLRPSREGLVSTVADGTYLDRLLALVGERDTLDALEDGGRRVEAAVRRLGPAGLARPWAPGKWTGTQVLTHLTDSEIVQGFRTRQILAEQPHTIQEYDEGAWMGLYDPARVDVEAALATFVSARRWNLSLYRSLTPAQLDRVGFHPKRGNEQLAVTLRALAGHTYNHLAQIEKL